MLKMDYKGVAFECDMDIDEKEAIAYIEKYLDEKGPLESIRVEIDGDYANVWYSKGKPVPFQRIRRITGYLVGTLDRFNDAKRAEESQRVKHSVTR